MTMINKNLKLAFVAAVALASITSPVFAQAYRTAPHRHLYNYVPSRPAAPDLSDPHAVDNPPLTGGGTEGYNECAGHPRC